MRTEEAFHFRHSILHELNAVEQSPLRSLVCALQQYAANEGVLIDEKMREQVENGISYKRPPNKMYATFVAFILLNALETNFLTFARNFFREYMEDEDQTDAE